MPKRLIYAEDAIDAVHNLYVIFGIEGEWVDRKDVFGAINSLPSAQPTQTNTPNALKTLDCVDRQAAIDAIDRLDIPEDMCVFEILSHIELEIGTLPSAQPERLSCDGCRHNGMWYEELANGYDCPCTRCIRNVRDNYEA